MLTAPATAERPEAPLFSDGLGDRAVAVDGPTGDLLQILHLRSPLVGVASFEFALRERAARLANFRHAYYARVRRIDRHPTGLAIVSDHVEGVRLSDMLRVASTRQLHLDVSAALYLVRQLVPSVALLHENARDVAHGLIAPERLVVTPHARLVVLEHVLGSAVEQLQYTRERLWQDLRIVVPASAGPARFDHKADVMGIGVVTLALLLGRPLEADEYPHGLGALVDEATSRSQMGEEQPLPQSLVDWLTRALRLDPRHTFSSAIDAQLALEALLADEAVVASPVALETFLSRYITALLEPPMRAAEPAALAPAIVAAIQSPAAPKAAPDTLGLTDAPGLDLVAVAAPAARPTVTEAARSTPQHSDWPQPTTPVSAAVARPTAPASLASTAPDISDLIRDLQPLVATPAPEPATARMTRVPSRRGAAMFGNWRRLAVAVLAMVALGEGGVIAARAYRKPAPLAPGTLSVQTNPPGVAVFVDGVAHGNTPARLSLTPGSHIVELRGRGVPRVIPISVTAGAETSQYLELPETPSVGSLLVQSDPAGAKVSVDGTVRGVAPISLADLAPGEHEVTLQAEGAPAVHQRVVIQAGVTASVLAPVATAAPGPISGWLSLKAPVTVDIRESGRSIGTSDTDRIMLASGRHDLELVNETLGYHATRAVQVQPGKTATVALDLPQGVLNINASPWAEVWIDGRRIGETPIGNFAIAIGPHEIVFRNPQLGEKKQAVSVTLNAPVRLSVDMK